MSIINVVHDQQDSQEHVETWSRWVALAAFVLLITVLNMDATVVNLTIDPVMKEMKSNLKILQWIISIYGIAWSVFVIPSGKFATNALILSLGGLAYNVLRYIGQLGLIGDKTPVRHPAKRRRIKTVIQELMYLAARFVKTGRRLKIIFSRHCPAFEAFDGVYKSLAFG